MWESHQGAQASTTCRRNCLFLIAERCRNVFACGPRARLSGSHLITATRDVVRCHSVLGEECVLHPLHHLALAHHRRSTAPFEPTRSMHLQHRFVCLHLSSPPPQSATASSLSPNRRPRLYTIRFRTCSSTASQRTTTTGKRRRKSCVVWATTCRSWDTAPPSSPPMRYFLVGGRANAG